MLVNPNQNHLENQQSLARLPHLPTQPPVMRRQLVKIAPQLHHKTRPSSGGQRTRPVLCTNPEHLHEARIGSCDADAILLCVSENDEVGESEVLLVEAVSEGRKVIY